MEQIDWSTISVVVSTYNRPYSLKRLLENLSQQQNINPTEMDVAVVDDGSTVRSTDFSDFEFKFEYIYRERDPRNLSRVYSSRNLAASRTTGKWILQLDDDLEIEKWSIGALQSWASMLDYFGSKVVLFPRMSNNTDIDHDDKQYHRGPDGRWWRGKARWQQTHWESSTSAGLLMSRELWSEVGGYDEQFDGAMGIADRELVLRCQKAGAQVWIAPWYVNIADEETGSWRMPMIDRAVALGRERNETIFERLHPDAKKWCDV